MANPSECCIQVNCSSKLPLFSPSIQQVFCRVRPLNESEKKNGSTSVVKFQTKDTVVVGVREGVLILFKLSKFRGNPMFSTMFSSQMTPRNMSIKEPPTTLFKMFAIFSFLPTSIIKVLNGYNGTIFAYGQTSSGKTHTMEVTVYLLCGT